MKEEVRMNEGKEGTWEGRRKEEVMAGTKKRRERRRAERMNEGKKS